MSRIYYTAAPGIYGGHWASTSGCWAGLVSHSWPAHSNYAGIVFDARAVATAAVMKQRTTCFCLWNVRGTPTIHSRCWAGLASHNRPVQFNDAENAFDTEQFVSMPGPAVGILFILVQGISFIEKYNGRSHCNSMKKIQHFVLLEGTGIIDYLQ